MVWIGFEKIFSFEYNYFVRVCCKCKKEKTVESFNYKIKSKGIRSYNCRDCSREYIRDHYKRNRAYYLEKTYKRNLRIRDEIKRYIWEYLKTHTCVDCSDKDPIVLEFDHISDKVANVSGMYRKYSLKEVKVEIGKCQIRCANRHRRKTAKELGWNKKYLLL